ncbi:MAG: hypothetical protein NZ561_07255, partial [Phycisphaerae bacterium]|nr:hypothetical protein [Phycisphaerae bacterium]
MKLAVMLDALTADADSAAGIRAAAERARSAGLTGITIRLRAPALDLTRLDSSGLREFHHIFRSRSLRLIALQHDVPAAGLHPEADLDREIDAFDDALRCA